MVFFRIVLNNTLEELKEYFSRNIVTVHQFKHRIDSSLDLYKYSMLKLVSYEQ